MRDPLYANELELDRVPGDVVLAMKRFDVWEVFRELPRANRDQFLSWLDRASDPAARERRLDTLVMALRISPLM